MKGRTSDASLGCTGQSLLRQHTYIYIEDEVHEIFFPQCLSPDLSIYRMAAFSQLVYTADHSTYVQILTCFFNSPSTLRPAYTEWL